MSLPLSSSHRRWLFIALFSVLAVRLLTLDAYPFLDTTEARYGEMARKMLETQNWVTPQFDYGVPFWGKPPLATWLSAGSYQLFGVNEFSARLPSLALALIILALVYSVGRFQRRSELALVATTMLASSVLFFVAAGAVIMDTALVTGITLAMVSFWRAINGASRGWGYAFFIGISIGLLSKGPLTLPLVFIPIGIWAIWQGNIRQIIQRIPWFSGSLLILALSLPWYILAELRTPGFLDYFIIGEHWKRFTISGWQGDLYGSAHAKTRGTIWLYAIAAFLPWSFVLPGLIWRKRNLLKQSTSQETAWMTYLALWAIIPLLFFTFAGNILATYTLPSLIPIALLSAEVWLLSNRMAVTHKPYRPYALALLALITPLLLIGLIYLQSSDRIVTRSQKDLVTHYQQLQTDTNGQLIYLKKRPFSAQYYSHGQALEAKNWQQITVYLNNNDRDFYAIKQDHLSLIGDGWQNKLGLVGYFHGYMLLHEIDRNQLMPWEKPQYGDK